MKTKKHLYYHGDREISEAEALDPRTGMLRDQTTMRVRTQMRDSAARDAREQAYEMYDRRISEAWRNTTDTEAWQETDPRGRSFESTGQGEHGQRGQAEGDSCTVNGAAGTLRMVKGELQCVPLKSSSDSRAPRFSDGSIGDPTSGHKPGFRIRVGDNRQVVKDAYDKYRTEVSNRWKCGDQQQVCSSCSGSGLDPEDGDTCFECGGTGVTDIDNSYEQSAGEAFQSTAADKRTVDQRVKDHQRNMARIYDAYDQNLGQMYRSK